MGCAAINKYPPSVLPRRAEGTGLRVRHTTPMHDGPHKLINVGRPIERVQGVMGLSPSSPAAVHTVLYRLIFLSV